MVLVGFGLSSGLQCFQPFGPKVDNKPVPWSRAHQAFRDHLQNKQWKTREPNPDIVAELESRRQLYRKVIDHNSFTIEEMQTAIDKLKKGKAPGPDKLVNELFMLLMTTTHGSC